MRGPALFVIVAIIGMTPIAAVCRADATPAESGGCCCGPAPATPDDAGGTDRFDRACCCIEEGTPADDERAPSVELPARDGAWLAAAARSLDVAHPPAAPPRIVVRPEEARAPPPTTLLALHTLLLC